MSARAGSIGSIVLGVAIIAIGGFSPGAPAAWFAGLSLIAGGIVGLVMQPQAKSQQLSRVKDLEIATAGEGFPVSVIFGTQKVTGNFMAWNRENFRAREVKGESGVGGKGGGPGPDTVIGYDYHLSFEYALCMGPVDAVRQVWSSPGEKRMMGEVPAVVEFGVDEYKEIPLDEVDPQAQQGRQRGIVRLYRGSDTQTRVNPSDSDPYADNGMNYRNLCWGLFMDFGIGRVPQPRTYQFVLTRYPRCVRDNGTTVTEIQVRGSNIPDHPGYTEANPAAILYEIATNKLWGRGLSSDIIDEASFIAASEFYQERGIGLSMTLTEDAKLADTLEAVRQHVKAIMIQDGDKVKLKVMLSNEQVHGSIQTITKESCTKLSLTRRSWAATTNELRVEFSNRRRNFRPDEVHATDIANMALNGKLNPQRIHLAGFTDYNMARRQAFRILRELSYPLATATLEINRFKSQLQIGDCFRLVWDDFSSGEVTAYFIVTGIFDSDSHTDDIRLTAIEDVDMAPTEGRDLSPTFPATQPWERIPDIDEEELQLGDPGARQTGEIQPIIAVEVPAVVTQGAIRRLWIVGERPAPSILGMEAFWAPFGSSTFKSLGMLQTFAITGELITTIGNNGCGWDRSAAGFLFSLTNPALEADMLSQASLVTEDGQDLEALYLADRSYMIVGEEVMMIGRIVSLGANVYRATNFLRGVLGSKQHVHEPGEFVFYTDTVPAAFNTANVTPTSTKTQWKAFPIGSGGVGPAFGTPTPCTASVSTDRISVPSVANLGIKKWSAVRLDYTTQPTPLSSADVYFVREISTSGNSFKLANQVGGAAINITNAGAGLMIQTVTATPFFTFHEDPAESQASLVQKYMVATRKPPPPSLYDVEVYAAGSPLLDKFRFRVRPRFFDKGAGTAPLLGAYDPETDLMTGEIGDLITGLSGTTFSVQILGEDPFDATNKKFDWGFVTPTTTYDPDLFSDPEAGLVTLENIPKEVRSDRTGVFVIYPIYQVRIWANRASFRSTEALIYKP